MLWLLEFQIRRGRMVETQVFTVNSFFFLSASQPIVGLYSQPFSGL